MFIQSWKGKGYDYIYFDRIAWYREQSKAYTKDHEMTPVPAIAFFHIPLPEYNQAASDEHTILAGTRKEKACDPELNAGMFVAMKEMGDVVATFAGRSSGLHGKLLRSDIRLRGGSVIHDITYLDFF